MESIVVRQTLDLKNEKRSGCRKVLSTAMFVTSMLLTGLVVFAQNSVARTSKPAGKSVNVVIKTESGDIVVEIDGEHAPITAANFLHYVDQRLYDGGSFFRSTTPDNQKEKPVPIEVIQGGPAEAKASKDYPAIKLERTSVTGLKHVNGAISMARGEADSATISFFICINDQPGLDYGGKRNPDGQGFAAFGKVISGMDVVKKIQMSPEKGEALTPPVKIISIRRQ
jgi:peptidyl-prolyl cis-trans isomerase A (cyclophilin A)